MDNNINQKPYDKCVECPQLGVNCDGPNFAAMTADRLVEWMKLRKHYLGWSNAKLAELSDTPKGTVDRVLAGGHADFKTSTISPMLKALVGGSWGQYPCPDPDNAPPEVKELLGILEAKDAELNRMRENFQANFSKIEDDADKKIQYLKGIIDRQDAKITKQDAQIEKVNSRFIKALFSALVLAAVIIAALFVDKINPNIGFFWLQ